MRIFGINILTSNTLRGKLADAKVQQRKTTNKVLAGVLDENIRMRRLIAVMKGSKHAGRC